MTQSSLISVIVPVYKVEPYLNKCIDSIVNQNYKNLEIILVDDGSPDNCGAICDAWAEKDSRIRVIHKENSGGGMARNAGLDIANGEFVAFVDSDDYISIEMYEYLHGLIGADVDVVECSYMDVSNDDVDFSCGDADVQVYTAQEAMEEHISDRIFRQLIWNKLYRREVIGDIRFPEGKSIDDEFFTYRVLGNAKTLVHSGKICYAYRQQENSVMHSMDTKKRLQAVEAKIQRHNYINRVFPELNELSLKNLWFTCIYQGQLAQKSMMKEEQRQTMRYLQGVLTEYSYGMKVCSLKEKMWLKWAAVSLKNVCWLRNALKIGT